MTLADPTVLTPDQSAAPTAAAWGDALERAAKDMLFDSHARFNGVLSRAPGRGDDPQTIFAGFLTLLQFLHIPVDEPGFDGVLGAQIAARLRGVSDDMVHSTKNVVVNMTRHIDELLDRGVNYDPDPLVRTSDFAPLTGSTASLLTLHGRPVVRAGAIPSWHPFRTGNEPLSSPLGAVYVISSHTARYHQRSRVMQYTSDFAPVVQGAAEQERRRDAELARERQQSRELAAFGSPELAARFRAMEQELAALKGAKG